MYHMCLSKSSDLIEEEAPADAPLSINGLRS
jgi:hypothetical protein